MDSIREVLLNATLNMPQGFSISVCRIKNKVTLTEHGEPDVKRLYASGNLVADIIAAGKKAKEVSGEM